MHNRAPRREALHSKHVALWPRGKIRTTSCRHWMIDGALFREECSPQELITTRQWCSKMLQRLTCLTEDRTVTALEGSPYLNAGLEASLAKEVVSQWAFKSNSLHRPLQRLLDGNRTFPSCSSPCPCGWLSTPRCI